MLELFLAVLGVFIFIAGFYTGVWIQRHSYTDREVPKIVETEKVVVHEKPTVIQVPVTQKPSNGPALPIMGKPNRNVIEDPKERDAAKHMIDLLGEHPEA